MLPLRGAVRLYMPNVLCRGTYKGANWRGGTPVCSTCGDERVKFYTDTRRDTFTGKLDTILRAEAHHA